MGGHYSIKSFLAPCDENWFYTQAACTARRLNLQGGAGVGSITKIYRGRQRNGVMPSHLSRGSRSVGHRSSQDLWAENNGKGPRWGLQTDTSGTERFGKNHQTGGSCHPEALEQMLVNKLAHSFKKEKRQKAVYQFCN